MNEYHSLVSATVGEIGGHVHKLNGDGHLISFGVMDEIPVNDLPDLGSEGVLAEQNRKKGNFERSVKAFERLMFGSEALKIKYFVGHELKVGAGLAYGEIEVKVLGDELHRKELDIVGESIVRSVRLEGYSKLLNKEIDGLSSFLVIDPCLGELIN